MQHVALYYGANQRKMKMLEIFDLKQGSHKDPAAGTCAMEVVAWLAGEPHTDKPKCACPVIGAYVIAGNDQMDHATRQRLKAYIPRISGSRDPAAEKARYEHFAWAAVTQFAPAALDAAGLHKEAARLRGFDRSLGFRAAAAEAETAAWAAAKAAAKAAWAAAKAAEAAVAAAAEAAVAAAAEAEAWDLYFQVLDTALNLGEQGRSDYDFTPRVEAFRVQILENAPPV